MTVVSGIFLILHALVHLLYAGRRCASLNCAPAWPGRMVPGCSRGCEAVTRSARWLDGRFPDSGSHRIPGRRVGPVLRSGVGANRDPQRGRVFRVDLPAALGRQIP
jgi:hypothetical protein